jgi:MoxR-like ATPase
MTTTTKQTQTKLVEIEEWLQSVVQERNDVIHDAMVALVANQHLIMVGPGGTGKSLLVRSLVSAITDSVLYETALAEGTDPSEVLGAVNIKGLAEDGVVRRITKGTLVEANYAFLDELFNGNKPLAHSIMAILNERVFHNGGLIQDVPLRSVFAGTNKLTADADLAAYFDRIHFRCVVGYVNNRDNQEVMLGNAVSRLLRQGRGGAAGTPPVTVSLEDIDQAHREALEIPIEQDVLDKFLDIRSELASQGIIVSDRRMVEGMVAVLSNAWLAGHTRVHPADLEILVNMWWVTQEHIGLVNHTVLGIANPNERAAMDLLAAYDEIKNESREALNTDVDRTHRERIAMEAIKNLGRLIREAQALTLKNEKEGVGSRRAIDLITKAETLRGQLVEKVLGLPAAMASRL